jgi:hypothetical protein
LAVGAIPWWLPFWRERTGDVGVGRQRDLFG